MLRSQETPEVHATLALLDPDGNSIRHCKHSFNSFAFLTLLACLHAEHNKKGTQELLALRLKQLRSRGSAANEGKYDTNAFPIVISFSLNCTSRRNALKIFLRFIAEPSMRRREASKKQQQNSIRFRVLLCAVAGAGTRGWKTIMKL